MYIYIVSIFKCFYDSGREMCIVYQCKVYAMHS